LKRSTRSWRTPWSPGVGDDQRLAGGDDPGDAGGDDPGDAGGALVEHLYVAGAGAVRGRHGGVPDLAALGDLGDVDLAQAQAVPQRVHERAGDVSGRAGAQHGLGEAVHGFQGRSDG
jgi:hypothetical protein